MNHLRYMKGPLFTMLCTLIRYVTKLTCPKFTALATLDVWRQLVCTITESLYPISDTHSILNLNHGATIKVHGSLEWRSMVYIH